MEYRQNFTHTSSPKDAWVETALNWAAQNITEKAKHWDDFFKQIKDSLPLTHKYNSQTKRLERLDDPTPVTIMIKNPHASVSDFEHAYNYIKLYRAQNQDMFGIGEKEVIVIDTDLVRSPDGIKTYPVQLISSTLEGLGKIKLLDERGLSPEQQVSILNRIKTCIVNLYLHEIEGEGEIARLMREYAVKIDNMPKFQPQIGESMAGKVALTFDKFAQTPVGEVQYEALIRRIAKWKDMLRKLGSRLPMIASYNWDSDTYIQTGKPIEINFISGETLTLGKVVDRDTEMFQDKNKEVVKAVMKLSGRDHSSQQVSLPYAYFPNVIRLSKDDLISFLSEDEKQNYFKFLIILSQLNPDDIEIENLDFTDYVACGLVTTLDINWEVIAERIVIDENTIGINRHIRELIREVKDEPSEFWYKFFGTLEDEGIDIGQDAKLGFKMFNFLMNFSGYPTRYRLDDKQTIEMIMKISGLIEKDESYENFPYMEKLLNVASDFDLVRRIGKDRDKFTTHPFLNNFLHWLLLNKPES